jgi:ethanolamine ammonia-lyase large subunit
MKGGMMVTGAQAMPTVRYSDKEELNRLIDDLDKRTGFVPDPNATIEKLREMLLAEGVRPEDNALTRELLQMRYGDEP